LENKAPFAPPFKSGRVKPFLPKKGNIRGKVPNPGKNFPGTLERKFNLGKPKRPSSN